MSVKLPGRPIDRLRDAFTRDDEDTPQTAGMPPDWLATGAAGAGLGWIFGPVGGAIGAGITHIMQKRQRNSVLMAAAADQETGDQLNVAIDKALGIASGQAETDQDNAELAVLEAKRDQLAALMNHYNPAIRELGIQGMLNLADQIGANLDEMEAAGLQRAADGRAREALEFDRLMNISDDLVRDSQQFVKGRAAWQRLMAVEPTEAGDLALIYNYMKVLDPESTVREGEAASVQNAAGVPAAVLTAYNRLLKGGERLDPARRDDIRRQAGLAYSALRSQQIDRNSLALERGRDAGLSDELLDTLAIPIDANELSLIPPPAAEGDGASVDPVALPPPEQLAEVRPGLVARAVGTIGRGAQELSGDIGRVVRGETLLDGPNGRQFIRDAQGNIRETEAKRYYERDDGTVLERVDHGDGRYEWREVDRESISQQRENRARRGIIVRPTN